MKSFSKFLALGAVLAASSSFAFADQISIGQGTNGGATFNTTSIQFTAPFTTTGESGIFSVFAAPGTVVTFPNPTLQFTTPGNNFAPNNFGAPGLPVFTITNGTTTDTFFVTGDKPLNPMVGYTYADSIQTNLLDLGLGGTGYFTSNMFTGQAAGNFQFTSQDSGTLGGTPVLSFSGTAFVTPPSSVTPEPNSLVLLGTGLAGAAGMLFMRRRQAGGLI